MELLVKFYKDVPGGPKHIPAHWPAEVIELPEGHSQPVPHGWVKMSQAEYDAYRAQHWVENKRDNPELVQGYTEVRETPADPSLIKDILIFNAVMTWIAIGFLFLRGLK